MFPKIESPGKIHLKKSNDSKRVPIFKQFLWGAQLWRYWTDQLVDPRSSRRIEAERCLSWTCWNSTLQKQWCNYYVWLTLHRLSTEQTSFAKKGSSIWGWPQGSHNYGHIIVGNLPFWARLQSHGSLAAIRIRETLRPSCTIKDKRSVSWQNRDNLRCLNGAGIAKTHIFCMSKQNMSHQK